MSLFVYPLFSLAVFLAFRLIHPWVEKRKAAFWHKVSLLLPYIELAAWAGMAAGAVVLFEEKHPFVAFTAKVLWAILLLILAWLGLKEIVSGLFFRAKPWLKEEEELVIGSDIKGKVKKLGVSALLLETESKGLMRVPYSYLSRQGVRIGQDMSDAVKNKDVYALKIRTQVPWDDKMLESFVYDFIYNSVWVYNGQQSRVRLIPDKEEGGRLIAVSVRCRNSEHAENFKNNLTNALQNQKNA